MAVIYMSSEAGKKLWRESMDSAVASMRRWATETPQGRAWSAKWWPEYDKCFAEEFDHTEGRDHA